MNIKPVKVLEDECMRKQYDKSHRKNYKYKMPFEANTKPYFPQYLGRTAPYSLESTQPIAPSAWFVFPASVTRAHLAQSVSLIPQQALVH